MNVDKYSARLENEEGLSRTLGMHFISTPEPDTLMAKMAVDDRNKQTFGFLSGGRECGRRRVYGTLRRQNGFGHKRKRKPRAGHALWWHGYGLCTHSAPRVQVARMAHRRKER